MGAGTDGACARDDLRVDGRERVRRTIVVGVDRVIGRRVAWITVPYQRAGENGRARRDQVAEPLGPRAIVGDPAEGRDHGHGLARHLRFLIKAAAS